MPYATEMPADKRFQSRYRNPTQNNHAGNANKPRLAATTNELDAEGVDTGARDIGQRCKPSRPRPEVPRRFPRLLADSTRLFAN